MKTTVLGVRLNDYQREQLKKCSENRSDVKGEADTVRMLIDDYIEGNRLDCKQFIKAAKKRGLDPQRFLDEIAKEFLHE